MDIEMCLYCVGADLYGRGGKQFHVDNLSSAHVYLRMAEGQTWDQLPKELVEDCAQLTKANSIEGATIPSPPQIRFSPQRPPRPLTR